MSTNAAPPPVVDIPAGVLEDESTPAEPSTDPRDLMGELEGNDKIKLIRERIQETLDKEPRQLARLFRQWMNQP